MKIFWWQLGVHLEPETPEENKALRLLVNNARSTSIGADPLLESTGVLYQHLSENRSCDLQVGAGGGGSAVEKFADQ